MKKQALISVSDKTGVVDFATWYRISHIYVAVTGIAELNP